VAAAKGEGTVDAGRARTLTEELERLKPGGAEAPAAVNAAPAGDAPATDEWGFTPIKFDDDAAPAASGLTLVMRPAPAMYAKGHDATFFLRELERLGPCEIACDAAALPPLESLSPEISYLTWTVRFLTPVEESAVREIFDFVGEDCPIEI